MSIKSIVVGFAFAACALIVGHPTDAAAQASRTWVSGVGDDVNPCSRTAPCKTFAGAISKTATGGIIDVLDPGGYGTVTITKSITIRGTGTVASLLAGGVNAVTINAPAGSTVNLIDLQIEGAADNAPGVIGVSIVNGSKVLISGCTIRNFKSGVGTGVKLASTAAIRLALKDTLIYDNLVGLDLAPGGTLVHGVVMDNTVIDNHPTAGIRATGAASLLIVHRSTAVQGIQLSGGAVFQSYGDNALLTGFTPTTTLPLR